MHVKPLGPEPPIPTRPQIHSAKHHHTYNGTLYWPISLWVRSPTIRATETGLDSLVYEIRLFYRHNRACTIYRSWDDFTTLRNGFGADGRPMTPVDSEDDVEGLHKFLWEAVSKREQDCALEYFLRRRIEDCAVY